MTITETGRKGDPEKRAFFSREPSFAISAKSKAAQALLRTLISNETNQDTPEARFDLLNENQRKVAILKAQGKSEKEIAGALKLTTKTVNNYSERIFQELGINRTYELVIAVFKANLVPLEELKEAIGYKQEMFDDLSKRELEVLSLLAKGLPHRTIADQLAVSTSTLDNDIKSIRKALGDSRRIGTARIITAFLIREKEGYKPCERRIEEKITAAESEDGAVIFNAAKRDLLLKREQRK